MKEPFALSRRQFVAAAIAGGFTLAGCARSNTPTATGKSEIDAAEAARPHTGRVVTARLTARPTTLDLGGTQARTLAYGAELPGPLIRANVGDELAVTLANELPRATSVHWHGIALRNDLDGASPATPDVEPGRDFTYRFSVPHSGTYWAHPHTGLDADYGLYLPVIVDDPNEPGDYDAEWIVVLDDWTDGVGKTPEQIWQDLGGNGARADMPGMDMSSMAGVGTSTLLGGDAGDVSYPYYLINGRIPSAPTTFNAKPGQRIRMRIINAGSDTAFRIALAGHPMTVTHTDGFPVVPTDVDTLLLGMGERYDVIITAGDGIFPLVAMAEGKDALARAVLSTGAGDVPNADYRPAEFDGRIGTVDKFAATAAASLPAAAADTTLTADLTGSMMAYDWAINGVPFADAEPMTLHQGQRVTLTFKNTTMMWHPMHLHGHTFQMMRPDGSLGARKDTAIVLPMQTVSTTFVADNPGIWMMHCHNTYHQEAGMMTSLDYVK
jgi:multicopper oxidase